MISKLFHGFRPIITKPIANPWRITFSICKWYCPSYRSTNYSSNVPNAPIISSQGVATDPKKIQAVRDWPTPTDVKQLRGFLGLSGYYRKFIKHYGVLSKPLSDLLKKGALFTWTPQLQRCFDTLKQALVTAPVLALPNFSKVFILETDASDKGIGVELMQGGHPIAYLSKALGPKAQAMSTYEKECMALLLAVSKWKPYLQHHQFTILTDHKSLVHLREQKLTHWGNKNSPIYNLQI
jgi:hypothetical protein